MYSLNNKQPFNLWIVSCWVMEGFIYFLIIMVILKLFSPEVNYKKELELETTRLSKVLHKKEEKIKNFREQYRLLKVDDSYLETVSRDKLDLQKKGEHIIRIDRKNKD